MPEVSVPVLCTLDVQCPSVAVRVPPGWYGNDVWSLLANVAILHFWYGVLLKMDLMLVLVLCDQLVFVSCRHKISACMSRRVACVVTHQLR